VDKTLHVVESRSSYTASELGIQPKTSGCEDPWANAAAWNGKVSLYTKFDFGREHRTAKAHCAHSTLLIIVAIFTRAAMVT
jgi:hypothetical protein